MQDQARVAQTGARIRMATPADASAIAAVHVASWRTTYRGLMPESFLAELSIEARESMWKRNLTAIAESRTSSCVLVAEDDAGQLIGFASAGPEREKGSPYEGELYAIYLLGNHQRRGTGSRLFRGAVRHLAASGYDSMRVWVLASNPSRAFYERMGGVPAGEKTIRIGEANLNETAYGWSDLTSL